MKGAVPLHPFSYVAPTTVDAVTSVLTDHGKRARPIVGGTDLLVQVRGGRFELDAVVDIKNLSETNVLDVRDGILRLGAAVPFHRVYENEEIRQQFPGLIDAAELVGGIQIQSRASFGGNLCNATPSGDTICPLIVYKAEAVIVDATGQSDPCEWFDDAVSVRTEPVENFCTGPGKTVMSDGEWLIELRIPVPPKNFSAAYERFIPRNEMDIAVAGVASSVQLDDEGNIAAARVALASVAPIPLLVSDAGESLIGKPPTTENFTAAGDIAGLAARPISDMRGTSEQRVHLVRVLTRRTLELAAQRAQEA